MQARRTGAKRRVFMAATRFDDGRGAFEATP
jgi:hypothetical protein